MDRSRCAKAMAGLLVGVVTLAGCSGIRSNAEQTFHPNTPGVLAVATTLPAPGFWDQDADGTFTGGFEYEIAKALADRFGLRLEVVAAPFDDLTHARLGAADLALAQISITGRRAEDVDFSTPYFTTSSGVLADDGTEIPDLKTAREQRWAVTAGSTHADFLDDVVQPTHETVELPDDEACASAVLAGTVDAALLDTSSAIALQGRFTALDTVSRFITDEHYGAVVPRGDENLEVVDAGLRALAADGSLRDFADDSLAADVDPNRIPVIVAAAG